VFGDLPSALRRSAGPNDVEAMQRVCSAFLCGIKLLRGMVSGAVMEEALPQLTSAFMARSMDISLKEACESCDNPWSMNEVAEFAMTIRKNANNITANLQEKANTLRAQVLAATFEELTNSVNTDVKIFENYAAEVAAVKTSYQDRLVAYKRRRHQRGLAAAHDLMDASLRIVAVDPSMALGEVQSSKAAFEASLNTQSQLNTSAPYLHLNSPSVAGWGRVRYDY
jgi:hypothetical protein